MVAVDISRPLHIEGIDLVTADVAGKRRRAVCRNSHPRAAACLAQRVVGDQAPSPKVGNGFHLEVGGAEPQHLRALHAIGEPVQIFPVGGRNPIFNLKPAGKFRPFLRLEIE